jgi:hypothetical protein
VDRDERVQPRASTAANHDILVIEGLRVAIGLVRWRRGERGHCTGGGDPPAEPVDDSVPVVVPGEVLPVDVLDDEVGWVVAVEPSGVVDVEDPGVAPEPVVEVPVEDEPGVELELEVEVSVEVVEGSPVVDEALLSEGAAGLTPPLPGVVEMPPVARTLTLTGAVVVIWVEVGADAPGLFDAVAESPPATPVGGCGRATSGEEETVGAGPLDSALGAVMRSDAAGDACATRTTRAW